MLAPGNYIQWKSRIKQIRNQLNAEAEAVQIILTGIDNDIYSTVDACPNACEMWKAIERLKQGESINVQDLETNLKHVSYHKLYDILKQHQHEVNEIRAEKIARVANLFSLVAQQQQVNHHQTHPTHFNQNSSTRTHQSATRKREKAVVNSPQPIYDQEPSMVDDDDEDTSKNAGYEGQRSGTVAGARDTVELEAHYMYMAKLQQVSPDVDDSGPIFDKEPEQKVQNDDHYNVFAIDDQHSEQFESVPNTYLIEQDTQNVSIESEDMNYDSDQI
nr:hypothetical protein [Tanacetum cinerariifolium]